MRGSRGVARERFGVPGASIGVEHDGAEDAAGFGVTSIEHPLEVNAETLFQIGSITKTVTGTLALQLVEKGESWISTPGSGVISPRSG